MNYPDDDNGDVLRRMAASGDDLSRPRDVEFIVVFPDEDRAANFSDQFRNGGYKTEVDRVQTRDEHPWEVVVVVHMLPTHEAITGFEGELQRIADPLDGFNDGWGCFAQQSEYLQ